MLSIACQQQGNRLNKNDRGGRFLIYPCFSSVESPKVIQRDSALPFSLPLTEERTTLSYLDTLEDAWQDTSATGLVTDEPQAMQ